MSVLKKIPGRYCSMLIISVCLSEQPQFSKGNQPIFTLPSIKILVEREEPTGSSLFYIIDRQSFITVT